MSDIARSEKGYGSGSDSSDQFSAVEIFDRPTGLKGFYYNPYTQVVMLGFVCFMCPGSFNALTGLGGGGQIDASTSANANSAHYALFAWFAFFAGSVNNVLGSKLTLLLGSMGYSLYLGSYLAINIHPNLGPFVITAGAINGICAGLIWAAQGSLMLAYPTENQKGRFIGVFWTIFNLGSVVGASVSLGQNFHSTSNSVGNGTYIGFLVLTLIGVIIPMCMADPNKMIRTDGTKVTTPRHPSWRVELYGLYVALKTDPLIVLLFPMFFASNWFYTWQFNDFNGALFNIRARSLNNVLYWMSQIIGSLAMGFFLDRPYFKRRVRAYGAWIVLLLSVFGVQIWAYFYQKQYTRASIPDNAHKLDIYDKAYVGRVFLYIACGILDAMWQTTTYWMMGAMSNDPAKLAYFTGFYKSIQSAGAAGVWRADGVKLPYMNIFISTWVLLAAGLLFALPMIYLRVKDHTDIEDETIMRMDDTGRIQPTDPK
ncbi:MFS general substrate transporter [Dentipellis sp. KUC8613]|nr:MFS general substrate transporter [Dentipellis sp. KUC8613]